MYGSSTPNVKRSLYSVRPFDERAEPPGVVVVPNVAPPTEPAPNVPEPNEHVPDVVAPAVGLVVVAGSDLHADWGDADRRPRAAMLADRGDDGVKEC